MTDIEARPYPPLIKAANRYTIKEEWELVRASQKRIHPDDDPALYHTLYFINRPLFAKGFMECVLTIAKGGTIDIDYLRATYRTRIPKAESRAALHLAKWLCENAHKEFTINTDTTTPDTFTLSQTGTGWINNKTQPISEAFLKEYQRQIERIEARGRERTSTKPEDIPATHRYRSGHHYQAKPDTEFRKDQNAQLALSGAITQSPERFEHEGDTLTAEAWKALQADARTHTLALDAFHRSPFKYTTDEVVARSAVRALAYGRNDLTAPIRFTKKELEELAGAKTPDQRKKLWRLPYDKKEKKVRLEGGIASLIRGNFPLVYQRENESFLRLHEGGLISGEIFVEGGKIIGGEITLSNYLIESLNKKAVGGWSPERTRIYFEIEEAWQREMMRERQPKYAWRVADYLYGFTQPQTLLLPKRKPRKKEPTGQDDLNFIRECCITERNYRNDRPGKNLTFARIFHVCQRLNIISKWGYLTEKSPHIKEGKNPNPDDPSLWWRDMTAICFTPSPKRARHSKEARAARGLLPRQERQQKLYKKKKRQ